MRRLFVWLSAYKKPLLIGLLVIAVMAAAGYFYFSQPAKAPIPMGFTWYGMTSAKDTQGFTLNDPALRVMYTSGLVVIQNKDKTLDDPYQITGGEWFYRTTAEKPVRVVVVNGSTKTADWTNIMSVSNSTQFCAKDAPCSAGMVWLLTNKGEVIQAETGPHQYVVINP